MEGEGFEKVNNLPEVSQLVNGRPQIWNHLCLTKTPVLNQHTVISFPMIFQGIFFEFVFLRMFNITYFNI